MTEVADTDFCSRCNSKCCRGNRESRTPYFAKDKELGRVLPKYIKDEDIWSCENIKTNNRCAVYMDRPIVCRLHPIYPTYNKGKIALGIALNCEMGMHYAYLLSQDETRDTVLKELRSIYTSFFDYFDLKELNRLCESTSNYKWRLLVDFS